MAPRSGWFATLRLESGFLFSGGSGSYLKVGPELRGYLPIGSRVVLAARARFGTNLLSEPIPISQRYFDGGADSHRGFGRRRLSPQVPSTEGGTLPVGGEASFESRVEVRVDLFKIFGQTLGVASFVDAGDCVLHLSDLDFGNLHYAVGPGIRLTTPVGVIRVDVGFRLNRMGPTDPDPNSRYAISFSLGEAFCSPGSCASRSRRSARSSRSRRSCCTRRSFARRYSSSPSGACRSRFGARSISAASKASCSTARR